MLTKEQKEMRRTGIGSSDIAALVGKSPYATPFDVYLSKTEGVEFEGSFAMELGDLLEDPILTLYERRVGQVTLIRHPGTGRHPRLPFIVDSPDALAQFENELRPVEAKTSRFHDADLWGEEGTDEVPEHYLIQAQWHMLNERERDTSVSYCDIPVLIRTDEFRIYRAQYDGELASILVEEAARFWRNHVEKGVAPEIRASDAVSDWLRRKHPQDNGEMLTATPEDEGLMRSLFQCSQIADERVEELETIKAKLKARIGDASGIVASFGQVTWKKSKGSLKVDWESVSKDLGRLLQEHVVDEIVKKHTGITQGTRRLLKKPTKAQKAA